MPTVKHDKVLLFYKIHLVLVMYGYLDDIFEEYFGGERVAVVDQRLPVLPIPAVN